jgi:hypothetical protein
MRATGSHLAAGLILLGTGWVTRGDEQPVAQPQVLINRKVFPVAAADLKLAESTDPAAMDKKALDAVGLKKDDAAGILKYLRE